VSTNKNYDVNNEKARHLSHALLCLLVALLLVVTSFILVIQR
jgi:hypothetical protein